MGRKLRVDICAPMGVGKTTLVQALGEDGAFFRVFENAAANPHLSDFYASFSAAAAYRKDAWFVRHVRDAMLACADVDLAVMDFSVTLCRAYVDAGVNTPENALRLQRAFDVVERECGVPDLLLVLDLPLDDQVKRIQARSRSGEECVPVSYLQHLRTAIDARVRAAQERGVAVLRLDFSTCDVRDPATALQVSDQIRQALRTGTDHARIRAATAGCTP